MTDAAFNRQRQEFVPIEAPLQDRLRRIANRVQAAVEAWEHYRETMPWLEGTGIRMVLDEWSAGGWRTGDIAGALGAALVLHEMFQGARPRAGRAWTLSSPRLDARSVPGQEPASTVLETAVADPTATLTVPAASIQLYELPLR